MLNTLLIISDIILIAIIVLVMLMLLTAVINLFIRVPFVPSKKRVVNEIITLAKLKKGERVYDLGCGDGRFLVEAEKIAQVKGVGFEAAPIPFLLAHFNKWINHCKFKIYARDFFKANFKDAEVIFCYLGPEVMAKLCPKFKKECSKGTRIYSHTFHMEGMEPTKTWPKNPLTKMPTIYLYQI